METNTELLNRIEAHIKGRLAVAESRAASSELYEGKKIAYNSILGVIMGLRADCATTTAENTDLRAEFDKMCPPQTIQGSIAPEADLEAEIKRMIYEPFYDLNGVAIKGATAYITVEDVANIARHFAEWGAEHLKK